MAGERKGRNAISPAVLKSAARTLKLLAHPHRLRIIALLEDEAEGLPVYELTRALGIAQATVSQHLGAMERAGLLENRREGQEVWYRINDKRSLTILNCIRKGNQ